MSAICSALAYAIEPSLATLAASARLIGAATFALINDIAARSGNGSPASASSSSRVNGFYSCFSAAMLPSFRSVVGLALHQLVALVDGRVLSSVRVCHGVVGQDIGGDRSVDRDSDVRVDQGHRGPLGQLLTGQLVELLARQWLEAFPLA